jgi:L-ascorbate metabolism protein UlaG (beta-lactamase superfamily)
MTDDRLVFTALGNAGFAVSGGAGRLLFDPFVADLPDVPDASPESLSRGDWILITHSHWDHLNERAVAAAVRCGAGVIGPEPVRRKLEKLVPADRFVLLEPRDEATPAGWNSGGLTVTAYRTRHGRGHNSYLVAWRGFRFFHDGDNEHTETLPRAALHDLDALMIAPWQGSGWVDFIDALAPRVWLLMHMAEEEFAAHDRGQFFPDLCDHVPAGLAVLRPGRTHTCPRRTP